MPNVVLGFDFGLSRIGVAVGQSVTQSTTALTIVKAQRGEPDWQAIADLIAEWRADALIVGLPLNMNGSSQPIAKKAKQFGEALRLRFQLPVFWVDERLTTIAAREKMHRERQGKKRFEKADSVSAQLIVESWMADNNQKKS